MTEQALAAQSRKKPYPPGTAEARALTVVGEKWTLLIVKALRGGPVRFVDLRRDGSACAGISTEQLRVRLAAMVDDGLVTRTRYREVPPRVMYELTRKGMALRSVLSALEAWDNAYGATTVRG